eukprot:scaffold427184_cov33-Prasinocladus_malaysianus.AAC.1
MPDDCPFSSQQSYESITVTPGPSQGSPVISYWYLDRHQALNGRKTMVDSRHAAALPCMI